MKILFTLLILLVCSCSEKTKKETDKPEDVVACFTAFKSAVLASDGEKVYQTVDKNTKDYYERIYKIIMEFEKDQLQNLTLGEKLQVLTYRHRIPRKTLVSLNGKKLFIYIFNEGWSIDEVKVLTPDQAEIKGLKASLKIKAKGTRIPLIYNFNKEKDLWKIDLAAVNRYAEDYIQMTLKNSKMNEEEFLFKVIGASTGKPVTEAIYEPTKNEPAASGKE